jgi:hypothetical protein
MAEVPGQMQVATPDEEGLMIVSSSVVAGLMKVNGNNSTPGLMKVRVVDQPGLMKIEIDTEE